MRFVKNNVFLKLIFDSAVSYLAPINLNYLWNFGSIALVCLVVQIISGVFLAMHYTPHVEFAFKSVEHIMRDVNWGALLRYIHANGASFFFFFIYLHMFRGMYYGSYIYPRNFLWMTGVIIFFIMILTAFMGYVLPWGQMSFWAATVITNLASAVPVIGSSIVIWLWGGFSVDNATLNRFYSLHYLLPFVICAIVIAHLVVLHLYGSSNPLGVYASYNVKVPFTPYYTMKDVYGLYMYILFFVLFVFFLPNVANHPDNYIAANPMSTPAHIVPEWYFLPFYAMLRSIPNKLGGVIVLLLSIIVLLLLPWFNMLSSLRASIFKPQFEVLFFFFLLNYLVLGFIGSMSIETPFYQIGQVSTILYFSYFIIFIPLCSLVEVYMISPWMGVHNENSLIYQLRLNISISLVKFLTHERFAKYF